MGDKMKRRLLIVIAVILISIAIAITAYAEGVTKIKPGAQGNFNGTDSGSYPMKDDDEVGVHFHMAGDALFVGVCCPSWGDNIGDLTLSLYAFEKDYATSISKEPIRKHEFTDYEDNYFLGFDFPENNPLKSGQYVIVLSDPYDPDTGVGLWVQNQYPGQRFYGNGQYNPALSARMYIEFKGDPPEVPYVELGKIDVDPGDADTGPYPFLDGIIRFSNPGAEIYADRLGSNLLSDISIEDGKLKVQFTAGDYPCFQLNIGANDNPVPCEQYPVLLIRMKTEASAGSYGDLFFNTTEFPGPAAGGSVALQYEDTRDWQNIIVNLSSNRNYTGDLISIRYDVARGLEEDTTYLIDYILFFGTEEAAMNFKEADFETLPTPEPSTEPTSVPEKTQEPKKTEKVAAAQESTYAKGSSFAFVGIVLLILVIAAVAIVVVVVVLIVIKKKKK